MIYIYSTFTMSSATYQGKGRWRRERGRRKKDEDIVSRRRSVSPKLVQTCCDELSREPPFSCQQAKAASTAQSQAVIFYYYYFCAQIYLFEAGMAEKHFLCTDIPTVASAINSAFVNSPILMKISVIMYTNV